MPMFEINGRPVGPDHPPFLIAEAGINHNGDVSLALEMIRTAKSAAADAIKFQTFKAVEFVGDPDQTYTYFSRGEKVTESMLEMFRRYEFSREAWFELKAECDRLGIAFLSTPQNRSDLELLLELGISAIKVGSDDFTNLPLLEDYASTGLPLILSCGMADLAEVRRSLGKVGVLDGRPVALLLCTSEYPTPPEDVNLNKFKTLQTEFPGVVLGLSDHTQGPIASAVATAFGASLFEKHFTLDKSFPGPDHWFSEDPKGLAFWTSTVRTASVMLGSSIVEPTEAERAMRVLARRSLVALRNIARGELFSPDSVGVRRPGNGLPPDRLPEVLGRTAAREIRSGEVIALGDLAT